MKDCTRWAKNTCKFGKACEYKHDPEKEAKHDETVESCDINGVLSSIDDKSFDDISKNFGNLRDLPSNENESLLNSEDWTAFSCEICKYRTSNVI